MSIRKPFKRMEKEEVFYEVIKGEVVFIYPTISAVENLSLFIMATYFSGLPASRLSLV